LTGTLRLAYSQFTDSPATENAPCDNSISVFARVTAAKEFHVRRLFLLLPLVSICLSLSACSLHSVATEHPPKAPIRVYFSPNGGCTDAIIREVDSAKSEVLVQAYYFTSAPVGKVLIDAHKRGIRVEIILDRSQVKPDGQYCPAKFFFDEGIPVYIDSAHQIAHNKIMIIDRTVVITGSFNFTRTAEERNAENLLVIPSKELTAKYLEKWQRHREHSEKYEVR
jgi:phosphatidylserine/phosphatidylglycerophosphate/cardiolipin synthase-like enzyme